MSSIDNLLYLTKEISKTLQSQDQNILNTINAILQESYDLLHFNDAVAHLAVEISERSLNLMYKEFTTSLDMDEFTIKNVKDGLNLPKLIFTMYDSSVNDDGVEICIFNTQLPMLEISIKFKGLDTKTSILTKPCCTVCEFKSIIGAISFDSLLTEITEWTKDITSAIAKEFFIDIYKQLHTLYVPDGWAFSYAKWKELMENEMQSQHI